MKFGCFGFAPQLESIAKAGFSTAELDVGELMKMSEADFGSFVERAARSGLSFEVFSGLLPLSVRLHDRDFDRKYWLDYIEGAARRAAALGARMIPFGAGKCRSIPAGCADPAAAARQVGDFITEICERFEKYRLTLVIEPLGPANSNFLNEIGETAEFARGLGRDNCRTMCDLRHMYKLNEPFEDIAAYKSDILHAHIDYPRGELRLFPKQGDGYDYGPYFRALKQADYDAILTIEATAYDDFEREAAQGLALLQTEAARAGIQFK